MPSGGVYQPTTTTVGSVSNKSWTGPRFLGPGGSMTSGRSWPKSMVILMAAFFAIIGLAMVIAGAKWHREIMTSNSAITEQQKNNTGTMNTPDSTHSATPYVTVLVVGLLLMVVAFIGLAAYYRSQGFSMPCCPGKIAHIRQRLQSQHKFAPHISGTPMSAQYCPPSASTAPSSLLSSPSSDPPHQQEEPPFADVSEQQRLMSGDEEDPRIVLNPSKPHEDA